MHTDLVADMPVLSRLALAYAPRQAKPATTALLALDQQLASIARTTTEPMLGQLRYAWWRDLLTATGPTPGQGNAVATALQSWGEHRHSLAALVDGWEALIVAEDPTAGALQLIEARANAAASLALVVGHPAAMVAAGDAGRRWASADLAQNLSDGPARDAALAQLAASQSRPASLPRSLRSFAILAASANALGPKSPTNRGPGLLMLLSLMRIGLFGR